MRPLFIFALLIGVVMVFCGVAVVQTPEAAKVSALAGLVRLTPHDIDTDMLGMVLISCGSLAVLSASLCTVMLAVRILLLIPMQIVIVVQQWSIGFAILTGTYPDGYVPMGGRCSMLFNIGSCFIFTDQLITFTVLYVFTCLFLWTVFNPGPYLRGTK